MTTYRKTATVEAVQWTGINVDEVRAFLGDDLIGAHEFDGRLIVRTLEGDLSYEIGYWLVRNPAGEHYGCADDVFRSTYVEHDPAAAADAIMVELSGLVDGIDDADDVDSALSGVAQAIVAKVLDTSQPFVISDAELDAVTAALAAEEDDEADAELDAISDGLLRALDLLDSCSTEYRVFEELARRLENARALT